MPVDNRPRTDQRDITYTVFTRNAQGWSTHGTVADMAKAMQAAEQLAASHRFAEVKVEKAFFDPENGRQVRTTILERGRASPGRKSSPQKNFILFYLLALAVVGGVISFALTYYLAGRYLP